jgi:TPR repeat protein
MEMSADELYEHALFVYNRDGGEAEKSERFEALLRLAIKKKRGGHVKAMRCLADHLELYEKRLIEAAKIYEKLATKHNDAHAAYKGGYIFYYKADASAETEERALGLLSIAAEANIAEAIVMVAEHYMLFAFGDEEKLAYAAKLLKKIEDTRLHAYRDSTMGRFYYLLGSYLKDGLGTECDPEGAFDAFQMSIRVGSYLTEYDVGECYLTGFGTEKDTKKAFECFMNTKELYSSQYRIGWCYMYGEGVEKDEAEGIKWLGEAALNGDADAMYEYALATIEGRGVEADAERGLSLMEEAFDEGASMSAYNYLNKLFPDDYPLD